MPDDNQDHTSGANDHGHEHSHEHGSHGHEHSRELDIANELINFANSRLSEGLSPATVAAGMRHAAANFSAFAAVHMENQGLDVDRKTEEFRGMLDYYGERHSATVQPVTGLQKLVETVKNE